MKSIAKSMLALLTLSACAAAPPAEEEMFVATQEAVRVESAGLRWMAQRSEKELAALFGASEATDIPLGDNDGIPLLPRHRAIIPALAKIYVGSTWTRTAAGHELRDKFGRTEDGHLVTLFRGEITRGKLADVRVAWGVMPPSSGSAPHPLSPFREKLVLDGKPSLFVDYSEDKTPIVNRILDEIRPVSSACRGLYLGRAHFLRTAGDWVYLYWFALDFGGGCDAWTLDAELARL
jgi:hypothetical protein